MSSYDDARASLDHAVSVDAPTTMVTAGATHAVATTITPPITFKERLAQRRKELEASSTFDLPVIGYDDLWVRYRCLGYEETRAIGMRVEEETQDQAAGERLTAAAVMAEACTELFECTGKDDHGKPILVGLGYRWTQKAAADLFGVYLPEGVTARDALLAIYPYPRDTLMMRHWQDYLENSLQFLPELEEVLRGES